MNREFYILYICLIISILLSQIISFASIFLSEKNPYKEKVSSYECGFNPINIPGEPFSIRFFIVGILFLIFDLEISYLFPWSVCTNIINLEGQIIIIGFLIILTLGLIYEWVKGGLEWQ